MQQLFLSNLWNSETTVEIYGTLIPLLRFIALELRKQKHILGDLQNSSVIISLIPGFVYIET